MKRLAALLLAVAVALSACGSPDITQGRVSAKEHHPSTPVVTMICTAWVKGACSAWVPITTYTDESWRVVIVDGPKEAYFDIDQAAWDKVVVGQWHDASARKAR